MKYCRCCGQEIPQTIQKEETRILVGYTTRKHGYKGFKPIEIGTPIYEYDGYIFIEQKSDTNNSIHRVKYYKEQLNNL